MLGQIKKLIILAIVGGIMYFLLSYHIVFFGKEVELLPKAELSLEETFVNVAFDDLTTPKVFFRQNPNSRRDGIGDLIVERGLISDEELYQIEAQLDQEEE